MTPDRCSRTIRRRNRTRRLIGCAGLVCLAVGGCSSQQLYGAGQAWQKTECQRLPDAEQRARCLKSSATSFDEYQRQAAALRTRP